jgi:alkylresorcinol/alkylpyrone synthase
MRAGTQISPARPEAAQDTPGQRSAPRILAIHGALPANRYEQAEVTEALEGWLPLEARDRHLLRQLHANSGVRTRHFALDIDQYPKLSGFGQANRMYLEAALDLAEQAVAGGLQEAGLSPADVDLIVGASTTGIATPSLDARLANRLGLRPDVRRIPLFGLGCVAGAAGLARAYDYLAARPDQVAVLFTVELCSLTFHQSDVAAPTLVATALFGDGAACVVLAGAERAAGINGAGINGAGINGAGINGAGINGAGINGASTKGAGPRVLATRSHLYPDSGYLMGWDVRDTGFFVNLSTDIPDAIARYLPGDVDEFLAEHGLTCADIGRWVCHPGGPKVLRVIEHVLQLPAGATELTWRSLESIGNISSASVLHVLRDTCDKQPEPGTLGLLMAVGPGFCSELVLLQW